MTPTPSTVLDLLSRAGAPLLFSSLVVRLRLRTFEERWGLRGILAQLESEGRIRAEPDGRWALTSEQHQGDQP